MEAAWRISRIVLVGLFVAMLLVRYARRGGSE